MITLGEITTILCNFPDSVREAPIWGWGELVSWRGDYSKLSLTDNGSEPITIEQATLQALEAHGATFTGYKGGEYTMGAQTPVWGDNYGEYAGRVVEGIAFIFDENHLKNPYCKVLRG
jgi:hypothetical protein